MVVHVISVLAVLEERAELDGLVRFVVVHRTHVEPGQPHGQAGTEGDRHEGGRATRASFLLAVDLDFDVVVQVVRRVPVGGEANVAALRAFRIDQLALGNLDVLLVLPGPSFDVLSWSLLKTVVTPVLNAASSDTCTTTSR